MVMTETTRLRLGANQNEISVPKMPFYLLMKCFCLGWALTMVASPGYAQTKANGSISTGKSKSIVAAPKELTIEEARKAKTPSEDTTNQEPNPIPEISFTLPNPSYRLPRSIKGIVMFTVKADSSREMILRDEYKNVMGDKDSFKKWLADAMVDAFVFTNDHLTVQMQRASNTGDITTMLRNQGIIKRNLKTMYAWNEYIRNGW